MFFCHVLKRIKMHKMLITFNRIKLWSMNSIDWSITVIDERPEALEAVLMMWLYHLRGNQNNYPFFHHFWAAIEQGTQLHSYHFRMILHLVAICILQVWQKNWQKMYNTVYTPSTLFKGAVCNCIYIIYNIIYHITCLTMFSVIYKHLIKQIIMSFLP